MSTVTPDQFLQKIAAGQPVPAILLLGPDRYLRDLCRQKLIAAFIPPVARDWGVVRLSCLDTELDRILQQATMVPMLCPRQIVFATDLEAVQRLGEEARERAVDALRAYFADPPPFTVLTLEAEALDQRMNLFKLLSARTLVVAVELPAEGPQRDAAAVQLAHEMAKELGVECGPEAARLLAELLNGEPARMSTEVEKLATFVAPRKSITSADVEALVISEKKYSVWKLAEILAARKPQQALLFLDSVLREGEEPPAIIGALAWMYRKLIHAQDLPASMQGWQAARSLQMRPDTAELALRQSRRISRDRLLAGLAALYDADSRLKSGFSNDRAVLEFVVAELGS